MLCKFIHPNNPRVDNPPDFLLDVWNSHICDPTPKSDVNVTLTPKSENYKKLRTLLNLCFNGSEMQQHFYVGYNQQCEKCYSIGALCDVVIQLNKGWTISFLGGWANLFKFFDKPNKNQTVSFVTKSGTKTKNLQVKLPHKIVRRVSKTLLIN